MLSAVRVSYRRDGQPLRIYASLSCTKNARICIKCRSASFAIAGARLSVGGMMTFNDLVSAPSGPLAPCTDRLRLAAAAYLARFKGSSRERTASGLACYLAWCAGRGLDPLAAQRPHRELSIRWMQEIGWVKPSTISALPRSLAPPTPLLRWWRQEVSP